MKKYFLVALVGVIAFTPISTSNAMGINDLTHIHNIRVLNTQIIFGTHEGLYEYKSVNEVKPVSQEKFDVMGLSIFGKTLVASGHRGMNSKLPEPVGLLKSTDGGKIWQKVSLQGKVDFHLLEVSKTQIYGGDSTSGNLYFSDDLGASWSTQGKSVFIDIAPSPAKAESALGIRDGVIFQTNDAFKSSKEIPGKKKFSAIEWNSKRLIAAAGRELLISKSAGKIWQTRFEFKEKILVLAHSEKLIVVATSNLLYTSTDNGKTFQIK